MAALEGDLDQAAAEKNEHKVRTDCGRRGASGQEVAEPADLQRTRIARPPPARWHEADGGVEGDGGHGCAGASGRSKTHRGGWADRNSAERAKMITSPGTMKQIPPIQRRDAAQPPGTEDGQLGRGGAG